MEWQGEEGGGELVGRHGLCGMDEEDASFGVLPYGGDGVPWPTCVPENMAVGANESEILHDDVVVRDETCVGMCVFV